MPGDLPFVSEIPSIFLGRDDGAAYWGELGGGQLKWQVGVFMAKVAFPPGMTSHSIPPPLRPTRRGSLFAAGWWPICWIPNRDYFSTYYGKRTSSPSALLCSAGRGV